MEKYVLTVMDTRSKIITLVADNLTKSEAFRALKEARKDESSLYKYSIEEHWMWLQRRRF